MPATLSFYGASRTVTGSCYCLETEASRILIDCGLFQGSKTEKELNYRPFPFAAKDIAAAILTHAHIDHSGLLPKLVKAGFAGPIHATPATADLASVMLPDSGHIQEIEVEHLNKRNARRGIDPVEPIYTADDTAACMKLFRAHPNCVWFDVTPDIRARLWNAGHLLGSASIEIEIRDKGSDKPTRMVFSGDLGPDNKLLQPDPEAPHDVDYVICESTYGNRDREDASAEHRRALLRKEVLAAQRPGGVLLIPSFAVERTQELLSDLGRLTIEGALPAIPVYIDSPLATRASEVFAKHAGEMEGGANLLAGLRAHNVTFTETAEQSKALDRLRDFHIVIAASGMCEAGRIRHRLRNWLWREEATVLLVGYQAQGTLGRILQDGAPSVRIQGDAIDVRARIRTIDLYSGHADGSELAAWVKERLPIHSNVFLVHGEEDSLKGMETRLQTFLPSERIVIPSIDQSYRLSATGAELIPSLAPARIESQKLGRLDWHNDVSRLILDINQALAGTADEKTRGVLIRRLRRALEEEKAA